MSRHFVNKILRSVALSDDRFAAYREDPGLYVTSYDLTAEERAAFLRQDYATLYALGAHPFLLNAVVMMFAKPGEERAHSAAYRASIASHGRPSFET